MRSRDYHLQEHLPGSIDTKNIREPAEAICRQLHKINPDTLLLYGHIDELPSELLDHLAVLVHADDYDSGLDVGIKRKLIKSSIIVHKHKGTKLAVETHVSALFGKARVEEWFEYDGKPFTFRIAVDGKGAFDESRSIEKLLRAVQSAKNERSHLDGKDLGDIIIKFEEETTFPTGFALPIESARRLDARPPGKHSMASLVVGFLERYPSGGIREALPKSVRTFYGEALFHEILAPRHLNAVREPFEPEKLKYSIDAPAFIGILVRQPAEHLGTKLPTRKQAGVLVRMSFPLTVVKGMDAAFPRTGISCAFSAGFAMGNMFLRHIRAKPTKAAEPRELPDRRCELGIRTGILLYEPVRMRTGIRAPRGGEKGISLGIRAGTIIPKHVNTHRKE